MGVELLAPGGARVREEDVDVVGGLGDFGHEPLDFGHFGAVGGDRDGFRSGCEVRERIEGRAGGFASGGFAGGDVDAVGAGLEEAGSVTGGQLNVVKG